MTDPRTCVVIDAQAGSARLPGGMLSRETGVTLLEHTHRAASAAKSPTALLIATDSEPIAQEVRRFGGTPFMAREGAGGRAALIAEVASRAPGFDLLVSLPANQPEVDHAAIDQLVAVCRENEAAPVATLAAPIRDPDSIVNPAVTKVVFDSVGRALYFSRCPIPFVRDLGSATRQAATTFHRHVAIYAYRPWFLHELPAFPDSGLGNAENLEPLRYLDAGHQVRIHVVADAARGVETPADYAQFVRRACRPDAA